MVNGNRVFYNADNIGISGRVYYAKTASGTTTLYTDSACTEAAVGSDVYKDYVAGVLMIVNAGSICFPTAAKVASNKVSVDILTVASSTATVVTCEAALASGDTTTAVEFAKIVPSNS